MRIIYKILVGFKTLHNLAPVYWFGVIPAGSLRSENKQLICTTQKKYKHKGDSAFSQAGSKLWNDLLNLFNLPNP